MNDKPVLSILANKRTNSDLFQMSATEGLHDPLRGEALVHERLDSYLGNISFDLAIA